VQSSAITIISAAEVFWACTLRIAFRESLRRYMPESQLRFREGIHLGLREALAVLYG